MFNWLIEYAEQPIESEVIINRIPEIRREYSDQIETITNLALFFMGSNVLLTETPSMVSLPVKNLISKNQILKDVAPHFEDVKIISLGNQLEVINMLKVKDYSKMLFDNNSSQMKEIVMDLYRSDDMANFKVPYRREFDYYYINHTEIDNFDIPNSEEVISFIKTEYLVQNKVLRLIPTGWILQENLRTSLFIRFFSTFIPRINLWVDKANNEVEVAMIELRSK